MMKILARRILCALLTIITILRNMDMREVISLAINVENAVDRHITD